MLAAEPRDAIAIVFDALGATNRAATALDDVVVAALGVEPRARPRGAAPAVRRVGSRPGASTTGTCAPGSRPLACRRRRELLVVCGDRRRALRAVDGAGRRPPRCAPVRGIDPDAGFHVVRGRARGADGDAARRRRRGSRPSRSAGARSRTRSPARAGRCSTSRATHALERVQFGRPIASFQAVRHRLAEALVAVEALDATLDAARRRAERR